MQLFQNLITNLYQILLKTSDNKIIIQSQSINHSSMLERKFLIFFIVLTYTSFLLYFSYLFFISYFIRFAFSLKLYPLYS
jgi:uncharacterized membrane protein (DUF485 family)